MEAASYRLKTGALAGTTVPWKSLAGWAMLQAAVTIWPRTDEQPIAGSTWLLACEGATVQEKVMRIPFRLRSSRSGHLQSITAPDPGPGAGLADAARNRGRAVRSRQFD